MKRVPYILALLVLATIGWSAAGPAEWRVWWMEMCWVLGTFGLLAATYGKFRFSATAYALVSIWLVMHTIGAHYTFEHVPFGFITDFFGFERNQVKSCGGNWIRSSYFLRGGRDSAPRLGAPSGCFAGGYATTGRATTGI